MPAGVKFPNNMVVRAQPKGWMDTDNTTDCIDLVWQKRHGANLGVLHTVMVLDSFSSHITDRIKEKLGACHTNLVLIPRRMTSQIQPCQVRLNKPIKNRVCAAYIERLGEQALTPAGRLKVAMSKDIARQVHGAWKVWAMVACAFKKCGISNDLNGSEDELLWQVGNEKQMSDTDRTASCGSVCVSVPTCGPLIFFSSSNWEASIHGAILCEQNSRHQVIFLDFRALITDAS